MLHEATVDCEYLHFAENHLVVEACGAPQGCRLAASHLGLPTVLIDTTVERFARHGPPGPIESP